MEAALNVLEPVRSFVSTNTTNILMGLVVATALLILFNLTALVFRRKLLRTLVSRVRVLHAEVAQLQDAANRSLLFRIRDREFVATGHAAPRDPSEGIVVPPTKPAARANGQDTGTTR